MIQLGQFGSCRYIRTGPTLNLPDIGDRRIRTHAAEQRSGIRRRLAPHRRIRAAAVSQTCGSETRICVPYHRLLHADLCVHLRTVS